MKRKQPPLMDNGKPAPGSDAARKQGCQCPVLDNGHGWGSMYGKGMFWITAGCPVHGQKERDGEYS